MRYFSLFLLLTGLFSQATYGQVQFTGRIIGCPEGTKVFVFELNGLAAKPIAEAKAAPGTDSYQFSIPSGEPKIYGLGLDQDNVKHIILGKESGFTVWGNCEKMPYARTIGSASNAQIESIMKDLRANDEALMKYRTEYTQSKSTGQDPAPWLAKIAETDIAKKTVLDNALKQGGIAAIIAGLNTQLSYEKNNNGVENEVSYLTRVFFNHVDLKSKALNDVPHLYNAFKTFVEESGKAAIPAESHKKIINDKLNQIPIGSPAYRTAIGGAISGLKTINSSLFFEFAQAYIEKYRAQDQGEVARLDFDLNRNRTFIPGMEAPDLVGPTPEETKYSLKEMRGKVVLVDFWASWCGPCRRENPNVKAAYEKYKGKGFDILGVSLDKTKDAWVNAIAQDALPWHHISDLKGWQSDHAALYSVTSIPQTLLIDREGKIIERNLRGPALDAKLKELFGE
jgi:thiol-disulfide isomerase/thioredoxin